MKRLERLETERTWMRPFAAADLEAAFAWFHDEKVMRYIPTGRDRTREDSAERLKKYRNHQERHGFSKWIVMDRHSGAAIGDAGLYHLPDGERVELGYRLTEASWGRGLATELARAWVKAAFEFYEMEVIYAFAFPENTASLKVMEKTGFRFLQEEELYGFRCPLYQRVRS